MIRNAVKKATALLAVRLVLTLLACLAAAWPAVAADRAMLNMLGYSADGRYFAFEQFGIQDGSGFAFSEVFVVDLVEDKWTSGTPFKAQAEDEATPLQQTRDAAMDKARAQLDAHGIGVPVQILALIGDGAAEQSGKRLTWSTPACCGPGDTQDDSQALVLSLRGITSKDDYCRDMSPSGYALDYQDGAALRRLHEDGDTLPASRGCTLDYRIYAVVQPYQDLYLPNFESRRVAIIATYPFGFEGVDRRFLVVPIDR
jgi:predicted secreted protein